MPLPQIATPTYELTLPSTEEKIDYRPFLVKEEKLLVLAMESEDTKEITKAVKAVIKNCIKTKGIKVEQLPTFDIEYLFLNIRGKSVGEEVEVNIICPDDGKTQVPVKIMIDEIEVDKDPNHTTKFSVDDNLMVEMRYPSLDQFIMSNFNLSDGNQIEQSFDLISSCVDKIFNEEEVWVAEDFSKSEMKDFIESMNSNQFKKIESFFETMPKLKHEIKVKNPETGKSSIVILEGLSSFFA